MEIKYLNTDLIIESKQDISQIIEEFGADVFELYHEEIRGYQQAGLEIAGSCSDADGTINYFCRLVDGLPKEVREIWNECCSRVLDIGYESGTSSNNFRSEIKAPTIQRVTGIGASIVITLYPSPAEESASKNTNL